MTFRTNLEPEKSGISIHHQSPILSMGSCFAQQIGQRLKTNKFDLVLNPFGIIYNPISIAKSLNLLLDNQNYKENQLFEKNGLWHSFDHHSIFSHPDLSICLNQINAQLKKGNEQLSKANLLIITLGTSFAFKNKKSESVIANNHKLPATSFDKICLTLEQIKTSLSQVFKRINKQYPACNILLTVSPIRHIRNGLIENQRSKARLILACEYLSNTFDHIYYFPAYELLLDDLRDYRFYKTDMIHPSESAINYIWTFFKKTYFDSPTINLLKEIEKMVSASKHRPFHSKTLTHQKFIKNQLAKIQNLEQEYPFLDFEKEKKKFQLDQNL